MTGQLGSTDADTPMTAPEAAPTTPPWCCLAGLLTQVVFGSLTTDDLTAAVYFFGSSREREISASPSSPVLSAEARRNWEILRQLLTIIMAAEAEGRVCWEEGRHSKYSRLNAFLSGLGLPTFGDLVDSGTCNFSVMGIREAIRQSSLPYHVICFA